MSSKNYVFSIGIDKYSNSAYWKDLNNAVYDAQELTDILIAKYSFEKYPESLYNSQATKSEIFTSFVTLNQSVSKEDKVVIFFGGHGNIDPGTRKGFWVPYDGSLDRSTWIENSSIKNFISDCPAKHILLIIDSCFSGTFLSTARNGNLERSYKDLDSEKSRWVISSGGEEKVSDGAAGEHSPFTKKLIDFLKKNDNENFSVCELFNYVELLISSDHNQKPQCNYIDNTGHNDGQLVFTLKDNITSYYKTTIGIPNSEIIKEEYLGSIPKDNHLSCGKEILIVKSIIDDYDFMIIENFRFNDSNEKRIKFKDNLGILDFKDPDKSWEVIRRFATFQGLYNYIDSNPEIVNGRTIVIKADSSIENIENDLFCIYYSQFLTQLLNNNLKKMHCLHCGEKITDNKSYLVEFDDYQYSTAVGNVHNSCLRNIDRILGRSLYNDIDEKHLLKNFDFEKWINLLEKGQGQLTGVFKDKNSPEIKTIFWNPENNQNIGNYCIRESYDNGDTDFIMLGMQIQRFTENEIEHWLKEFTQSIGRNRPCKIVGSKIKGDIEDIERYAGTEQTISYTVSYEKVKYSKLFEAQDSDQYNDYTPLCYFTDENDELLEMGNLIPFITNPEMIEDYFDNWKKKMPISDNFKIKIVASDLELGNLISIYYPKDKIFVINPKFDNITQQLNSGLEVKTITQILNDYQKYSPEFRKGDIVTILINPSASKLPLGILLEDEFRDETGEICVIFSPFEDGEILDMMYKIPVKKIKKIAVEIFGLAHAKKSTYKFIRKLERRKRKLQMILKFS